CASTKGNGGPGPPSGPHGPASSSAAVIDPGSRHSTLRLDRNGASPSARRFISERRRQYPCTIQNPIVNETASQNRNCKASVRDIDPMPEFHAEPYIYLPALSHKSALIALRAFYFRTNSSTRDANGSNRSLRAKLVDDEDLKYVHPPRKDSIGAQSAPYGPARVEVYDQSGKVGASATNPVANHCWVAGLQPDTEYTYKVFVKGQEWASG